MIADSTKTSVPVSDYHLAAFIAAHDIPFTIRPDRIHDRGARVQVVFYFSHTRVVDDLISEFNNDVILQNYLKALHKVKDRMMPVVRAIKNEYAMSR